MTKYFNLKFIVLWFIFLLFAEKRILEEYYAAEIEAQSINSTVDWLERDEVICPLCKK